MPGGKDKILGPQGANMVGADGNLTAGARAKLVADIVAIMVGGNENGTGLIHTFPPFLPIPIFPEPGPKVILSPLHPDGENLFWFKPEPFAVGLTPILLDPNKEFQKLFVNGIYAPLVKMLNISGNTALGPVFDPTIAIDLSKSKFANLKIPDLPQILADLIAQLTAYSVPATQLEAKLALDQDFGIGESLVLDLIPLITKVPPDPPGIPSFGLPPIPIPIPKIGVSTPNLPDLALGIFKIPSQLIGQLIPEITSLDIDPPALLKKIIGLIVKILLQILQVLGLLAGLPKLILSFLMVLAKNLAVMLLCDVIGSLLGTGAIVKIVAAVGGVV